MSTSPKVSPSILIAVLVAVCLAAPASAQATSHSDSAWTKQGEAAAPRARAACPVCVPIAIQAIRTAAMRAAPVAIRAASRIGSAGTRTRRVVKAGSRRGLRWARHVKYASLAKATILFKRMPRYVKGCGRGFVDHIRDYGSITLLRALYACARGIAEIYLGKNPLGPIDR